MIPGSKGQKAVRACTIRLLNLGPAKHEKVAIYAVNQRISNVCRIAEQFVNIHKRRNRFRDSFGVCGYSRIVPRFCKYSESAGATSSCLAGSKFERFIVQARTAFEL